MPSSPATPSSSCSATTRSGSPRRCGWARRPPGSPAADGRFTVETTGGQLAGTERRPGERRLPGPRIPAASAATPRGHVHQLHSHDYRNPGSCPTVPCWWWAPGSPAARSPRTCCRRPRGPFVRVRVPGGAPQVPRPGHLLLDRADQPARPRVRHQRTPGGAAPLPRRPLHVQSAGLRQRRRPQHPPAGTGPPRRAAARPL